MINQLDVASICHDIFSRMKRATLDLQVVVEHVLKLSEWQWFGKKNEPCACENVCFCPQNKLPAASLLGCNRLKASDGGADKKQAEMVCFASVRKFETARNWWNSSCRNEKL